MRINASDEIAPKIAADMLSSEKLVIMPCDTIYGILGVCPETEERISRIKGRAPDKPYIRLVSNPDEMVKLSKTDIPDELLSLLPAPLTLVLRDSGGLSVGVRVPDDPRLAGVLRQVGRPVFSTSVNTSGSPPLWKISEILEEFGDVVDLILDGGDLPGGMPSTILDITGKPFSIIRQGACIVPNHLLES